MTLEKKTLVFLGDSITYGYGLTNIHDRFSDLIAAKCRADCFNYGISGTRIAHQPGDLSDTGYFLARIEKMEPNADVAVVFGGVNDYGSGTAPIGTMSDRTPDTFYGAIHGLLQALCERYPGKPIVLVTPLHCFGEENVYGYAESPKATPGYPLKDYVEVMREVAEYHAVPVLDLYRASGMMPESSSGRA